MKTILTAALMTLSGSAFAYEGAPVADGGTIAGTVRYTGAAKAPAKIQPDKDADYCGKAPLTDEQIQVGAGKGLRNVVVFLEKIERGKPLEPKPAVLLNEKCRYEPHVQAVAVGADLRIENRDPILHNTHIRLPKSDVLNTALPVQGQVVTQKIKRKGLMKVGCDAGHTWMSAYIAAFEHPYFAVTGDDGAFTLETVPPGQYTLVLWHEKLGQKTQQVTVTPGGKAAATVDFQ